MRTPRFIRNCTSYEPLDWDDLMDKLVDVNDAADIAHAPTVSAIKAESSKVLASASASIAAIRAEEFDWVASVDTFQTQRAGARIRLR